MGNAYNNASLLVTPEGYEAGTIFSAKPTDGTGDLAFSRASTAMRRNSAGLWEEVANNVPRLQYPVGGGCPSWLFEPQATNIFIASQVDDNINWFSLGSSKVFNSIQSPRSGFLATKLVEDTANSEHIMLAIDTGGSNATHTVSFYAKTNGRNIGVLNNGSGTALNASFNLTAGTASGSGSPTITDAGNGWWLCTCQYNPSTSAYNIQLRLLDGTTASYLGDGVSGAYVWGTQFELGSVATSPIITAGSAVTRLADVSRTTGLSSLIGQTEGTLFVEFDSFKNVGSITQGILFAITGADYIGIYKYGSDIVFEIVSSAAVLLYRTITYADGKAAITYNTNSFAAFFNGAKVGLTATIGVPPTVSSIDFGSFSTANSANGNIKPFELYKTQISDSEAIELTTL